MRKLGKVLSTGLVVVAAVATLAVAGSQIYDRAVQALSVTAGTATWTNTTKYAALNVKRIHVQRDLDAASTVTVTRVTSGGAYTSAVCTVVAAAGVGSQATLTTEYLKYGDMLKFANSTATGATMIVEYEIQD